jgi:hypothetical protein
MSAQASEHLKMWHVMTAEYPPANGVYMVAIGSHIDASLWDGTQWSTVDRFQEVVPLRAKGPFKPIDRWAHPPATLEELRRLIDTVATSGFLSPSHHPPAPAGPHGSERQREQTVPDGTLRWHTIDKEQPPRSGVYMVKQGPYVSAYLWDRGGWYRLSRHHDVAALGPVTHWAPAPRTPDDVRTLVLAADELDPQ